MTSTTTSTASAEVAPDGIDSREAIARQRAEIDRLRSEYQRAHEAASVPYPRQSEIQNLSLKIEMERADAFMERRQPRVASLEKQLDALHKERDKHRAECEGGSSALKVLQQQLDEAQAELDRLEKVSLAAQIVLARNEYTAADRRVTEAISALVQAYGAAWAAAWVHDGLVGQIRGPFAGLLATIGNDVQETRLRQAHPSIGWCHMSASEAVRAAAAPLLEQARAKMAEHGVAPIAPGFNGKPRTVARRSAFVPSQQASTATTREIRLHDEKTGHHLIGLKEKEPY